MNNLKVTNYKITFSPTTIHENRLEHVLKNNSDGLNVSAAIYDLAQTLIKNDIACKGEFLYEYLYITIEVDEMVAIHPTLAKASKIVDDWLERYNINNLKVSSRD